MQRSFRRHLILFAVTALLVAGMIIFPRVRFYFEIAMREMRFFWWLIALAGAAIFLSFRMKPRR